MRKIRKNLKILNELENNNNVVKDVKENKDINNINDVNNSLLVINIKEIQELNNVCLLKEEQIQAWLSLVTLGKIKATKEQLTAVDKLMKSYGMFEKTKTIATSGGAVYKWKSTVEAEIVPDEKTTSDTSVDKN